MDIPVIHLSKIEHRGEVRIALRFERHAVLESIIRQLRNRKWSTTLKCWHIPYSKEALDEAKTRFADTAEFKISGKQQQSVLDEKRILKTDEQKVNPLIQKPGIAHIPPIKVDSEKERFEVKIPSNQNLLNDYKQTLAIKRYSAATLNIYYPIFKDFVQYFDQQERAVDTLHYNEIFDYIKENTKKCGLSEFKQFISAIKFYYEKILDKDKLYFQRVNRFSIKALPVKFDFADIQQIAGKQIPNASHRLILYLSFYLGMPPKSIISLELEPINQLCKYDNFKQNELARFQIIQLIENHKEAYKNRKFLFEKSERCFEPDEMKQYIRWIVTKYRIEAVYRQQFTNILMQTDLEESTRKQYESMFISFIRATGYKHPEYHSSAYIKDFLYRFGKDRAAETQNAMVTTLRFYYRHVLKRELLSHEAPRAKTPDALPQVLSLDELAAIINSITNSKHKTLISVMYSAGLRRSDVQKIRPMDIDFDRGTIFIKGGKGKKDRYTILSPDVAKMIRDYLQAYNPKVFLFEGEKPGTPYSFTSMQKVLKKAAVKAGITKRVHLHLLRHSFATHVLEDGFDSHFLQHILGHNSIKTTQKYLHISKENVVKVRSPFDKLRINKSADGRDPPK